MSEVSLSATPLDTTIEIVTPENISFRYEIAGPFRRLPAWFLDLSFRFGALVIAFFAMALLGMLLGGASIAFLLIVWFLLEWFYGGLFETFMNGQTPGKRIMGIRVVSVTGSPITGLQAVLRNILRGVDMMPFVPLPFAAMSSSEVWASQLVIPTFFVGLMCQLLSPRFQRLGDIATGTMVVVDERRRRRIVTQDIDPRYEQLAALVPPNKIVSPSFQRALATYVERRGRIGVARRREIARHVAVPIIQQLELPGDTNYDLLLCALYAREQQRLRRGSSNTDHGMLSD